jgi:hypothetical protein
MAACRLIADVGSQLGSHQRPTSSDMEPTERSTSGDYLASSYSERHRPTGRSSFVSRGPGVQIPSAPPRNCGSGFPFEFCPSTWEPLRLGLHAVAVRAVATSGTMTPACSTVVLPPGQQQAPRSSWARAGTRPRRSPPAPGQSSSPAEGNNFGDLDQHQQRGVWVPRRKMRLWE